MNYAPSSAAIAREAWPFAVPLLLLTALCTLLPAKLVALVPLVLATYVLWFFRNPDRTIPAREGAVICPADGKVVAAGIVPAEGFPGGQALRIGIFMSLFNVHVNWAPVSGKILSAVHHPGRFLNAMDDKSSEENERKILEISGPDGERVVLKLVAGLVARRIVSPLETGDTLAAGEKIGLIRFGSRAEVLLPATSRLKVSLGDRVRGGTTIVAILPRTAPSPTQKATQD